MIISPAKESVTEAAFHKQGEFVNIKSRVNIVKFDYLQLHPEQISWDASSFPVRRVVREAVNRCFNLWHQCQGIPRTVRLVRKMPAFRNQNICLGNGHPRMGRKSVVLKRVNNQQLLLLLRLLILQPILLQTAHFQQHAECLLYSQLHKKSCGKSEMVPGRNRSPEQPALTRLQQLAIDLLYQRGTEEVIWSVPARVRIWNAQRAL